MTIVVAEEARTGSDSAETDAEPVDLAAGLSAHAHRIGNRHAKAKATPRKGSISLRLARIECGTVTTLDEMMYLRAGLRRKE